MHFDKLRAYMNSILPIDDGQWEDMHKLLKVRQFKRKALFQATDKQCTTVGFILEGCFRSVKVLDGQEHTFDFAIEGEFITDYYGILTRKPSEIDIVAVERSVVACMDADKLFELFDSSLNWAKIGRHIAETVVCYYQERLVSAFYETPKLRYERLMNTNPELFLRIPQHILANYLGMRKETLSRLRGKRSASSI